MARRLSAPLLLAVAYGVLILAWVLTNPPGSSPDEPAHLVRARATAHGQWVGTPATYAPTPEFGPRELPWINQATRSFDVDGRTVFPTIATCNAFRPEISSGCLDASLQVPRDPRAPRSYVGTYQPFAYVPAGFAANRFADPRTAILAGRLALGAISWLLLAIAVIALWQPRQQGWPLVGSLVAVSPAVLFAAGSMSTSGIEIAGAAATVAIVLRVGSGEDDRARWWLALAFSAVVLTLSRPLGPVWVLAAFTCGAAMATPREFLRAVHRGRRAAQASIGLVGAAIAVSLTWGLVLSPTPPRSTRLLHEALRAGSQLPEVLRQMIGVFGWLDTGMPAAAYAIWRVMVVTLVVLALLVGTRRARRVLIAGISAVVVMAVLVALFVIFPTGFDLQGRYLLPLAVAVPLLAGEIVRRSLDRFGLAIPRHLPLLTAAAAALVHAAGWYANARRHAVGVRGPMVFFGRGEWSPIGGWTAWGVVVAAGCALMVAAAALAQSSSTSSGSSSSSSGPSTG